MMCVSGRADLGKIRQGCYTDKPPCALQYLWLIEVEMIALALYLHAIIYAISHLSHVAHCRIRYYPFYGCIGYPSNRLTCPVTTHQRDSSSKGDN